MPESAVSGNSAPGIPNYQWDEIFDVVVVGSGGGALTSAMVAITETGRELLHLSPASKLQ